MIVSDLIQTVLEDLRVIGISEVAEAGVQNIVLRRLNIMFDSWSAQKINVYANTLENFPLIVGANPYTIGVGGNFNTVRPVRIENAYLLDASGGKYP